MIKNLIQEERAADLPTKTSQFQMIGSFEDFMSRKFKTIMISVCRTGSQEGSLFSPKMLKFILSRLESDSKVICIGKSASLSEEWKSVLLHGAELIER